MRADSLVYASIREISGKVKSGELSPLDLVDSLLERIEKVNPKINAYITVLTKEARNQAEEAEKMIKRGDYLGGLHGIPIGIKDNIQIRQVRCTAGSKILEHNIAEYDATVVEKIRDAGGIIVGTTNLHEFGSGVTNVNPFYGTTRNPWDTMRIPGGSSGGSAAAVAAGLAFSALGTDTSGSVRIPCSLCGVYGLKPTYGTISKYGLIPLSPTFDHVGFVARGPWDLALLLQTCSGYDPHDKSMKRSIYRNYLEELEKPVEGIKFGAPHDYFTETLDSGIMESFSLFLDRLSSLGLVRVDVNVEEMDKVYDTWAAIRLGEAAAFHQKWFSSRPEDYGSDVRKMLELGSKFTTSQYDNALKSQEVIKQSFSRTFQSVDMLVVPTVPITAPRIGENQVIVNGKTFDTYSLLTKLTIPFNISGLPALTLPIHLSNNNLPAGAQLVGRPFEESLILRVANQYEQAFGNIRHPSL